MRHHIGILLALVLVAAGCQKTTVENPPPASREGSTPPAAEKRPAPRDTTPADSLPPPPSMQVVGILTDEGVACPALRGDDGNLYTLTGDLRSFKSGDRVKVTGNRAEVSICQQGTTINVTSIVRQ